MPCSSILFLFTAKKSVVYRYTIFYLILLLIFSHLKIKIHFNFICVLYVMKTEFLYSKYYNYFDVKGYFFFG